MTRTRFTLDDIGGALPYRALRHFVDHLPIESELMRELHPELSQEADWLSGRMTAVILADVYDAVQAVRMQVAGIFGRARKPKPYRRPWDRKRKRQRLGSKPIPIRNFDEWWESHIRG